MFRRVSFVPKMMRVTTKRMFSDQPPQAPGSKAASALNKVLNVALILLLTSNTIYAYYFNKVFHARQYVTDDDMHEYRSQDRNVYQDKSDEQARITLLKLSTDADKKIFELEKERKPTMSAEIVAAHDKEAFDKWWEFVKGNLSFSSAPRDRNMDSYLSFYYTYRERVEKLKRDALEEAKAAAEREKGGN